VGIAVIVLCFVDKNALSNIQDKLGNGMTRAPFAVIVGLFTLLSLVACIPLGELFFFHMILIRKVCFRILKWKCNTYPIDIHSQLCRLCIFRGSQPTTMLWQ
jgi:hypothetical protein